MSILQRRDDFLTEWDKVADPATYTEPVRKQWEAWRRRLDPFYYDQDWIDFNKWKETQMATNNPDINIVEPVFDTKSELLAFIAAPEQDRAVGGSFWQGKNGKWHVVLFEK